MSLKKSLTMFFTIHISQISFFFNCLEVIEGIKEVKNLDDKKCICCMLFLFLKSFKDSD